jgi:hypothetical protein
MFQATSPVFDKLHEILVSNYGLHPTIHMTTIESLGMLLWTVGGPQSVSQDENPFERSIKTISRKFIEVLECVFKLGEHIIKPKDPQFTQIHSRLEDNRFSPHFNGWIRAIDGTHVLVIVPATKTVSHISQHRYTLQNVLVICDFDLRFTFVVVGWSGLAHDTRVFNDALERYDSTFPLPPEGIKNLSLFDLMFLCSHNSRKVLFC